MSYRLNDVHAGLVAATSALRDVLFIRLPSPFSSANFDPAFFDIALLRIGLSMSGFCEADASDATVIELYLHRPECRLISANAHFDENWYRSHNPDVVIAIAAGLIPSGFVHFINYGIFEGRWPNYSMKAAASGIRPEQKAEWIDEELYLESNPQVNAFLASFPIIDVLQHFNLYGRMLGFSLNSKRLEVDTSLPVNLVISQFDVKWYAKQYRDVLHAADYVGSELSHYLQFGARSGLSPNCWFSEDWYRAYYPDVREAIATGATPWGFYHYVEFGQTENRMPSYDLRAVLEAALPSVTEPTLLNRVPGLRKLLDVSHLNRLTVGEADTPDLRTLWFLLPVLNPDISFGGYQACFALMIAAKEAGFEVGILCLEEETPNRDYFVWREESILLKQTIRDCRLYGYKNISELRVAKGDLFLAYSVWGLKIAAQYALSSGSALPFLLAQEYEPIFYENNALRVICAELYEIPHHAIINSRFLYRYFQTHCIGPFSNPTVTDKVPVSLFEHRFNDLGAQSAADMAARHERLLVAYARPEVHASRNLFEMIVLALEQLCSSGLFGSEWRFLGIGALSDLPDVPLGGGHSLRLSKKLDETAYAKFMSSIDIGISMMAAPHPSVVPFEFATTGALVVTNVFENRSSDELIDICGNIVPCKLQISSLTSAIQLAVERVGCFENRVAMTLRPAHNSWSEIFSPDFMTSTFGSSSRVEEANAT